ncbi:hypothetical protein GXM_01713 [Nostoc sphaeroides CCNUC1]|uniref:Uncharacterized protein n=1 Tax=Nostoc sphaeroides CCNUC1 TaxID=2653204 RepID=A0A5P8VV46_9NOSO|nr:hypothetical protein GXM_01713 [Nostoc sphaeroides CCNUC1]
MGKDAMNRVSTNGLFVGQINCDRTVAISNFTIAIATPAV